MKTFPRTFPIGLTLLLLAGITAGCQQGGSAPKEDKMRAAYDKKGYTLDDVPPAQRPMVENMMKAGKEGKMPSPASSPAAKPSPTK